MTIGFSYDINQKQTDYILLLSKNKNVLNPLYVSRLLFLFSSVCWNILSFFDSSITRVDGFPQTNITLSQTNDYVLLVNHTLYLLEKSYMTTKIYEGDQIVTVNPSVTIAINAIKSYLDNRFTDGWNNSAPCEYPNGPNSTIIVTRPQNIPNTNTWMPVEHQNALGCNWKFVRGLIGTTGRTLLMNKFNEYNAKSDLVPIRERAKKVLEVSQTIGDPEKVISELWEGGMNTVTPPGMNHIILISLMNTKSMSLREQCYVYLLFDSGLFEASLIAWKIKYTIYQCRPIQSIRHYFKNDIVSTHYGVMKGEYWLPYQKIYTITPPFPDTISGHSTFSGVSSHILRKLFGACIPEDVYIPCELIKIFCPMLDDASPILLRKIVVKKKSSQICNILPRNTIKMYYDTWNDLACSAGLSRVYGGIHYESSNRDALKLSKHIANQICDLYKNII